MYGKVCTGWLKQYFHYNHEVIRRNKLRIVLGCAAILGELSSGLGFAQTKDPTLAVVQANKAAGFSESDSIRTRIEKSLKLLNEQHYFFPTEGPPQGEYELDSARTPDQILEQKVGGGCGSSALSIAAMLIKSGIPSANVRLIGTVVTDEIKAICPKEGRAVARKQTPFSLSGHVFVAYKDEQGHWFLVNATSVSNPAEIIPWMSPSELANQMNRPVQIPTSAYRSLLSHLQLSHSNVASVFQSGMTVFASWKLEEYPKHQFKDRYNLIASGTLDNEVCRYGAESIDKATKESPQSQADLDLTLPPSPKLKSSTRADSLR